MINNVVLVGRLTKDADLRHTSSGQAVAQFTIAVQRNFKTKNGEFDTDFINCVLWRKPAESLANYTRKGSLIGVTGRIQTRNYENQQGQRVYVTEVVCDNFQMLEPREKNEERINNDTSQNNSNGFNNSRQQNNQNYGNYENGTLDGTTPPSFAGGNEHSNPNNTISISDDDLPF